MRKSTVFSSCLLAIAALLLSAGAAMASEGEALPYGNFLLRIINVAIFLWIIWHFAGAKIKSFFVGRTDSIAFELDDLAQKRQEATAHLAEVEKRIAGLEAECDAMLAEGKAQAERIREKMLAEAKAQAAALVEQAKKSAEVQARSEAQAIRAQMAEEIVAAMEKQVLSRFDAAEHKKLINNSLSKVVLQ